MTGFFAACCGEGEEERKFGSFVDTEMAKEMGWDAVPQKFGSSESLALSERERIRQVESQISLVNKHRQSDYDDDELRNNDNRQAVFCKAIDLDGGFEVPKYEKTDEQREFLEAVLQNNFIVMDLSTTEKEEFVGAMQMEAFEPGAKIIQQGDIGDFFYIVETGCVDFMLEEIGSEGSTTTTKVGTCPAGGSFGELALLYNSPRAVSCIADESSPVTVWKVDQETFRYVLASNDRTHHTELKDLISQISIFKDLNADIVSRFVKSLTPVNWARGIRILQKGEEGNIFHIIQEGQVKVHDIGIGDSKVEDLILGPGDWFGERALLTGELRAANVTTISDVTTLAMERETFETCIGPLRNLLEREMRKQSLKGLPIFADSDVTDPEMDQLVGLMEEVCYGKGEKLAESGKQYLMHLWIIRQGKLVVYSEKLDKLYTMKSGGYFGDKSMKGPIEHISTHTATCEENLTTWRLTRDNIESVIGDVERLGKSEEYTKAVLPKPVAFSDLKTHNMLGQGAFGKVYLVSDTRCVDSTTFALKAISKVKVVDANLAPAVLREKDLLSILEHPFILRLVASYQDENNLYLLLPLVLGGELFSVVHNHKMIGRGLENNWAAFYCACITEALGHFGKYNIAYRDLKLENVLIDGEGYGIVIDLGFAKVVTEKTYTLCGTPEYLAPEIIMSRGHDHAVDYWALSILTYELLVGKSPFYQRTGGQMEMFKRIVTVKYSIPEFVCETAKDLIGRMLVRKQSNRLGNLANGYVDIKQHPWFPESGITFKQILRKEAKAPWVPEIKNPLDAGNFDDCSSFGNDRDTGRRLTKEEQELFKGF